MDNYIQPGDVVTLTAPVGGVTTGVPVQIGQLVGFPVATVAAGSSFECALKGVFDAPKATGQTWTEGAILYFDESEAEFTTVAAGNTQAGAAVAAAESADTTGSVRLDGVARVSEES